MPRYLILDTSLLLSSLKVLKQLAKFLKGNVEQCGSVELVIPGIVVQELDGLKDSSRDEHVSGRTLGQCSREASVWLLDELRERNRTGKGLVRGQALHETTQRSRNWKARENGVRFMLLCLPFGSETFP